MMSADPSVGPQYDSTHVYVSASDIDAFVQSFLATFGGRSTKPATTMVTPTASSTTFEAIVSPVGLLSVFAFTTPIPYPFGDERTGYLVRDMDAAVQAARAAGASVVVAPFPDPIGRDAVVRWPGGVMMQLYWHTTPPSYPALQSIPENRVYLSSDDAAAFVKDFTTFSHGTVESDDTAAPGIEIGLPGTTYHRIRLTSAFGRIAVLITDGHLPYPYGREVTGYAVGDVSATAAKAKAAGVRILVEPFASDGRTSAMLAFPGGFIAEIHSP